MPNKLSTLSLQKNAFRTEHDSRFPFVFQPGLMSKTEQSIAVKILLHNFTIK